MVLLALLAGGLCVAAGVYLLQWQSAGEEANWFETIARGMGIYFIGKGLFVFQSLARQHDQLVVLRAQLDAMRADRNEENPSAPASPAGVEAP